MKVYQSDKIRNVALLGHGGVGKTTIAEAMLFASGATTRQGKVTDGNTVSDFDAEEIKRKFSINTTLIPVEWNDCKINILDTPGYFDFVGEVQEALAVADACVITVSGKSGVEVGTELAWEKAEEAGLPRIIFVNSMDDPEANMGRVIEQLKDKFGSTIAQFQMPIIEGGKFVGFVDVPTNTGRRFEGNKVVSCDVPASMAAEIGAIRENVLEVVATTDDDLMMRYFDDMGESFTQEEILNAILKGTANREVVPVLCGCATNGTGIQVLLNSICQYFPTAAQLHPVLKAEDGKEIKCDDAEKLTVRIFKTIVDPFLGKVNYGKVMSGVLKPDTFTNANKATDERIGGVTTMRGKEKIDLGELHTGDIGAFAKLAVTGTGDTLCEKGLDVKYPAIKFDEPLMAKAITPANKGDEDKLAQSLAKIMEEDMTVRVVNDSEIGQQLLYGIGDQHLEVICNKMMNKFKTGVVLGKPKVSYRETIRGRAVDIRGKHKKQSGGAGQYGDVVMTFENSGDMETPYIFEEKIFGGSVPKGFFPAIEKGIKESVKAGVLAGFPMVGLKATLTDGSYHPVDSKEIAFIIAAQLAFKDGIPKANPVILEPIMTAHVTVDQEYVGDVMGDLNKRRGRVLGMNPVGKKTVLDAEVPMAEMFSYPTDLRSMTQGRGKYTIEFARYEETPHDVQEKIIAEAKAAAEEK